MQIHVNPQGGISLTTIISNVSRVGSTAPASTQPSSSTTSTSGSRMSASADNGAARETFSSSFGEQRSSVGTNTNGSSSTQSTQTGQPSVRTRIIVDDFIALISNVPASVAAAAAAQGQGPLTTQAGTQNQPQVQGQGVLGTASSSGQSQTQPSTPVSRPGVPNAPTGQAQPRPQGLPGALSMNVMSGMGAANSNHPDPSLPCQSFHFGPQAQRSQTEQASQPAATTQASATTTAAATATTTQSQAAEQAPTQTTAPVNPPQPQPTTEPSRPRPERRSRGTTLIYTFTVQWNGNNYNNPFLSQTPLLMNGIFHSHYCSCMGVIP